MRWKRKIDREGRGRGLRGSAEGGQRQINTLKQEAKVSNIYWHGGDWATAGDG